MWESDWETNIPVKPDEVEKREAAAPDCPDRRDLRPTYKEQVSQFHWLKILNSLLVELFDKLFALERAQSPFEYHYIKNIIELHAHSQTRLHI